MLARLRATAVILVASAAACSGDLFHSTDWTSLCSRDPHEAGCGGSSASSSHSSTVTSSMSATASVSSSSTGSGAMCGNGKIEPGEQCDDANSIQGDGCFDCKVECSGNNMVLDPKSNHCYELIATPSTWDGARGLCQMWFGDLATITSPEEQGIIEAIAATDGWIGATDAAMEGTWVWVTNEPFAYSNWNAGEPNNSGTGENCAELYGGMSTAPFKWNDGPCTAMLPAYCERAPAGMP